MTAFLGVGGSRLETLPSRAAAAIQNVKTGRPLSPQPRRFTVPSEMTGLRRLETSLKRLSNAQIADIPRRRGERVKSTLSCPSGSARRKGDKREKAVFC
jgi:hypothetical protein